MSTTYENKQSVNAEMKTLCGMSGSSAETMDNKQKTHHRPNINRVEAALSLIRAAYNRVLDGVGNGKKRKKPLHTT